MEARLMAPNTLPLAGCEFKMNSQWRSGWPIIGGATLIKYKADYKDGRFEYLYFRVNAHCAPYWVDELGMRVEADKIEAFYVSPGNYRLYCELGGGDVAPSNG
jgi:hypothetical protein